MRAPGAESSYVKMLRRGFDVEETKRQRTSQEKNMSEVFLPHFQLPTLPWKPSENVLLVWEQGVPLGDWGVTFQLDTGYYSTHLNIV